MLFLHVKLGLDWSYTYSINLNSLQKNLTFLFILFLLSGTTLLWGQTLTISDSGQRVTSGTNWSISHGTLLVSDDAIIHPIVIEDALKKGNFYIKVLGAQGSVQFNAPIRSNSRNSLQIETSSELTLANRIEFKGDFGLKFKIKNKHLGKLQ